MFGQSTGDPRRSINPPAHQSYRYNPIGPDRRGGGAVIPCKYILEIAAGKIEEIKSILQDFFKEYSCTETLSIKDQPCCIFYICLVLEYASDLFLNDLYCFIISPCALI